MLMPAVGLALANLWFRLAFLVRFPMLVFQAPYLLEGAPSGIYVPLEIYSLLTMKRGWGRTNRAVRTGQHPFAVLKRPSLTSRPEVMWTSARSGGHFRDKPTSC